jgi:NAD(P)-dependent dehydrogenase (short-subunit alcohol dehydrogenase family)
MPKLDGKVSLVTGGTSGIGLAAANALAREGSHVYITGRRERELATAVQRIGSNVSGVRGDVSNANDLDRLFTQIKDEKGKLDILFANAGIAKYAALGNITASWAAKASPQIAFTAPRRPPSALLRELGPQTSSIAGFVSMRSALAPSTRPV